RARAWWGRGLRGRGRRGLGRVGLDPGEGVGREASERVATAIGAEPRDVEPRVLGIDAVRRRPLAHAVGTDGEAGKAVPVLVEDRLELGLALTNASDRRLLHDRTEDSSAEAPGKIEIIYLYDAGTTRSATRLGADASGRARGSAGPSSRSSPTRS